MTICGISNFAAVISQWPANINDGPFQVLVTNGQALARERGRQHVYLSHAQDLSILVAQ
jgi:hypothetical protein